VDFELQKEIWDRAFGKHFLKVACSSALLSWVGSHEWLLRSLTTHCAHATTQIQPKDHDLLLTQPLFTPLALHEATYVTTHLMRE
jgi:hypothetical protein